MELRTVKELATLKVQVGPLQRQAAERLKAAVEQAKTNAIAQFKTHFSKVGFTVTGESRRYAAAYEGLQFFLEIAETPGPETFFKFSLHPPAALGEPKVTVHMVRKDGPLTERSDAAGKLSLVAAAEKELADARTALSLSAPAFSYVVVDEESEVEAVGRAHEVEKPVFETLGDFLESVYPQ
jgi:hypothetical protein